MKAAKIMDFSYENELILIENLVVFTFVNADVPKALLRRSESYHPQWFRHA